MARSHKDIIKEAVRQAIVETVDRAFFTSQFVVPVRTGYLKSTGKVFHEIDVSTINYHAPYSCIFPIKLKGAMGYPYVIGSEGEKRSLVHLKEGTLLKNGFGRDNEVIAIEKKKVYKPKLFKITTESGKVVILTDNHLLPVINKGLIKVEDLVIGDAVYTEEPIKKLISWNKGKTKHTDNRVKAYADKLATIIISDDTRRKMKENHWSTKREHSFNYLGEKNVECFWCKKVFSKRSSKVKENQRQFCSRECELDWRKYRYSGKRNPRYGESWHPYYTGGGYRADIGHYTRSRWEANLARILQLEGIKYSYEARRFFSDNHSYCPDFWIPGKNIYIELGVTGVKQRNGSFQILKEIVESNPSLIGKLFFIDEHSYQELEMLYKDRIPTWESKK
jgi:hypothetical protein